MDEDFALSFRSQVLLVSLVYVAYFVSCLVCMSIAAASNDPSVVAGCAVVPVVCAGLHVLTSAAGSLTSAGRKAAMVEPYIIILVADAMQSAALGSVVTAIALAPQLEETERSVVIASNALVAAAQLACFFKSSVLLDGSRFDQATGERIEDSVF